MTWNGLGGKHIQLDVYSNSFWSKITLFGAKLISSDFIWFKRFDLHYSSDHFYLQFWCFHFICCILFRFKNIKHYKTSFEFEIYLKLKKKILKTAKNDFFKLFIKIIDLLNNKILILKLKQRNKKALE